MRFYLNLPSFTAILLTNPNPSRQPPHRHYLFHIPRRPHSGAAVQDPAQPIPSQFETQPQNLLAPGHQLYENSS